MNDRFEACLQEVLKHEGGWSDHPVDPGGATMKGVTIGTLAQFKGRKVTKDELRYLSEEDLRAIYKRKYWDKVRGDDLPPGIDLVAFDAAVNSGPTRGARWLQTALGVDADGKVGPKTVAAANTKDRKAVISLAVEYRLEFLQRLKTWSTFGRGWQRRVDSVKKVALGMAKQSPIAADRREAAESAEKPFWVGVFAEILQAIAAFLKGRS